ncbi:MAG: YdeI/OmpD-associated family protein [Chloroflexi bacterium]|nr:YdeI/OmpD-associated family protein [Chloroflexota bacterium]
MTHKSPHERTTPNSVHPLTRAEWRAWLEAHHQRAEGVWLISYKKASGKPRFSYEESVEEALCFGWVDSKGNNRTKNDPLLWFAPRRPGFAGDRPNKERVERLMAAGLMAPAGLAKVEAAQRDGSWNSLDAVETLEVPPDLAAALVENPPAADYFATFPRSAKRGILEWIVQAKRPETRAKRIQETARLAAENIRANQWRP